MSSSETHNRYYGEKSIWMHIGSGSFHRAHQAVYLQRIMDLGENWSIALGNIRDDTEEMLIQLDLQHQKYTLETVTPHGERSYQVITSIKKVLPYRPDCKFLIDQGVLPETKVISLTVTESGYYHDVHFDIKYDHPDIIADLGGDTKTIYGAIREILKERHAKGEPVTLLSCDNVRHNGSILKRCLMEFLEKCTSKDLVIWVEQNVRCPNTMVDRITPHPSVALLERVKKQNLGFEDKIPVMSESFIQWVIEDCFCDGRPPLERVGVELVKSVEPYEDAKIKILNSSHALCAWAGTLIGLTYINEDITDTDIHKYVYDYVTTDIIPLLKLESSPLDLEKYRDIVLERFSNPHIADTNQRVSGDGWTKIPGFFVPTIMRCYEKGIDPTATIRIAAIYYLFFMRWHKNQLPFNYHDGCMVPEDAHKLLSASDPIEAYSKEKRLFGKLVDNSKFNSSLRNEIKNMTEWLEKRNIGHSAQ
ncbi:Mannitol-1-phosphate/altronate dehydrogenase [Heterostelium album PN500]|uniref:mannitol 2-dehydrogenase n=1 Tax=Heterostelium pallidum (strain ATCC 26659 / Pp 5 / PN500) TaxID=670386 RepID=D3BJB2_HETP5|nr:Mannitol-1-phosphate/altronate dehydrogenase [Heterostelium album PN500]EFA77992.1 Mannitol-1-phosphate/altronate dehydrogenase [Heterostelium album PN500]|eukprot:XP_020430120.1 Mannitol-1-phosphate/altronate dehydrogenase [Heterostelium album PN500]